LATRLFAGIERAFGVPLQLALLFERSTIEYLADCIRAATAPPVLPQKFSILVPMQTQGTRPPLFCVHGAGGQVLWVARVRRWRTNSGPEISSKKMISVPIQATN